jgi:hypothetical protein
MTRRGRCTDEGCSPMTDSSVCGDDIILDGTKRHQCHHRWKMTRRHVESWTCVYVFLGYFLHKYKISNLGIVRCFDDDLD